MSVVSTSIKTTAYAKSPPLWWCPPPSKPPPIYTKTATSVVSAVTTDAVMSFATTVPTYMMASVVVVVVVVTVEVDATTSVIALMMMVTSTATSTHVMVSMVAVILVTSTATSVSTVNRNSIHGAEQESISNSQTINYAIATAAACRFDFAGEPDLLLPQRPQENQMVTTIERDTKILHSIKRP
ncbi:hypothetical protein NL676_001025 [Syzygium grande]|nr:hypothetical protein NL676_001025 [Syzygium grande]